VSKSEVSTPIDQGWRSRAYNADMRTPRLSVTDTDLVRALPALKRAAAAAWRLSVETGTPFYVIDNGRIVDRNAAPKKKRVARPSTEKAGRARR
jgi:hypothetical protein